MPIRRNINKEKGRIMITVTGEVRLVELRLAFEALLVDPSYMPDFDIIWDMTAAETDMFSLLEAEGLYSWIELTIPLRSPESKSAFVVAKNVDFNVARMFASELEDAQMAFEVFSELEEAERWLNGS